MPAITQQTRDLRGLGAGTFSTFRGQTQRIGATPSGGGMAGRIPGASPLGLQDVIKQMQAAQEKANLMNEQRYRQILGQFEGLGKAGRARIEQQTAQRQAESTQRLTSRGLGSTTITAAAERGIASDAEMQRQQLEESVAMQKAGVMERRSDIGPDLGMFANMLMAAGQGQAAAPQGMRTTFRMGASAQAGRDVFGDPMGRFQSRPSTGGRISQARPQAQFFPKGTYGG